MLYWLGYSAVLLIGLGLGLRVMRLSQKIGLAPKRSAARDLTLNLTLSVLGLFLTFMIAEFYFRVFFAQSDAFVFTLAAQNWRERYWQPLNSLGYRDREWSDAEVAGKLKVMVAGDSIAAGQGINNYQDRFSNKLNELLGDEAVVFNVASPGWHTEQEIEAIVNYPYRPDILVLAYFVNDVEGAAFKQGIQRQSLDIYKVPPLLKPLIDHSYALNFLYWRLVRFRQLEGQSGYWQWVADIFTQPEVWWVHQQELATIYEGTQAEGVPLIVVLFPNITTPRESRQIIEPVLDFFESRGVATLDVATLSAAKDPLDLMASPVDAHPNEMVHRLVAQRLYEMIQSSK